MNTLHNSKPALAEVLVRQVLGDAEAFERICAQRGVSLLGAVTEALEEWSGLRSGKIHTQRTSTITLLLPDPSDCPQGQEKEWLAICEHDLVVLNQEQRRCYKDQDAAGLIRVNQSIERYLQAMSELRERVEVA